jgi:uncharacterized protein
MKIPEKVKQLFDKTDLASFATSDASGQPNVIAVYWKKIIDDQTIILIDNFMKNTKKNLEVNNKICLSFWNGQTEEGYKIKGTAKYHLSGDIYDLGKNHIQLNNPGRIPKGVVEIKVMQIYNISPGPDAGKKII